jgi:hypothetical protein
LTEAKGGQMRIRAAGSAKIDQIDDNEHDNDCGGGKLRP